MSDSSSYDIGFLISRLQAWSEENDSDFIDPAALFEIIAITSLHS
ncbi:MAG: hypothetical protein ACTSPV_10035 [Candidatus Hodarchaeales archaeon]